LNFGSEDVWINCVRISLSLHLFLAIPLLVLPCRLAAQRCYDVFAVYYCRRGNQEGGASRNAQFFSDNNQESSQESQQAVVVMNDDRSKSINSPEKEHHGDNYRKMLDTESSESLDRFPRFRNDDAVDGLNKWYYLKTFLIMFSALALALYVPSVLVMWSVVGATVSFAVCIWIPALLYLKLQDTHPLTCYKLLAMLVLAYGFIATFFFTWQAIVKIDQPACELIPFNRTQLIEN